MAFGRGHAEGRISFRLRVGVTGHRTLSNEAVLAERVHSAVAHIRAALPVLKHTDVLLTVVSPLAEGADRLVARELLSYPEARLEAALPLPPDEYENDFATDASKAEFRKLLAQAASTIVMTSTETREDAYEQVGRYNVDRCDVLIAVWDGLPSRGKGGTAEVVEYARERSVPVVWIQTTGQQTITVESKNPIAERPLSQIEEYNGGTVGGEQFRIRISKRAAKLVNSTGELHAASIPNADLAAWVLPYHERASTLAESCQNWYQRVGNAAFLLAAAAVAAAAAQILFFPDRRQVVWVEVGILISLLLIVFAGRSFKFHERWLAYRFLAERFRSAMFLALTAQDRRDSDLVHLDLGHESEEWLRRAFSEVWTQRPQVSVESLDVAQLRTFLAEAWIAQQLEYHEATSKSHRSRHERLSWATNMLFGATILVALLHASPLGGGHSGSRFSSGNILELMTISLPATAGAISGIRSQREYLRNSERFDQMARYLDRLRSRMRVAKDLRSVQAIAAETEDLMLEENRDWFVVMKFHDFELHV